MFLGVSVRTEHGLPWISELELSTTALGVFPALNFDNSTATAMPCVPVSTRVCISFEYTEQVKMTSQAHVYA